MGRPKKEEAVKENPPSKETPEAQKPPKRKPLPSQAELDKMDFGELKLCPKCGGEKPKGPTLDIHGHYRTFCYICKFWDSVVSLDPQESVDKWNAAGGPERY